MSPSIQSLIMLFVNVRWRMRTGQLWLYGSPNITCRSLLDACKRRCPGTKAYKDRRALEKEVNEINATATRRYQRPRKWVVDVRDIHDPESPVLQVPIPGAGEEGPDYSWMNHPSSDVVNGVLQLSPRSLSHVDGKPT